MWYSVPLTAYSIHHSRLYRVEAHSPRVCLCIHFALCGMCIRYWYFGSPVSVVHKGQCGLHPKAHAPPPDCHTPAHVHLPCVEPHHQNSVQWDCILPPPPPGVVTGGEGLGVGEDRQPIHHILLLIVMEWHNWSHFQVKCHTRPQACGSGYKSVLDWHSLFVVGSTAAGAWAVTFIAAGCGRYWLVNEQWSTADSSAWLDMDKL